MNQALLGLVGQLLSQRQNQRQFEAQMSLEERKTATAEHDQQLKQVQSFTNFLKTLPVESRQAFIDQAGGIAGVDPKNAQTLASSLPVDVATTLASLVNKGASQLNPAQVAAQNLQGMSLGANAQDQARQGYVQSQAGGNPTQYNEFLSRMMTGQGMGANAVDAATAQLPSGDLTQAARVGLSIGMSPQQVAQLALQSRGLDIEAQNANTSRDVGMFNALTSRAGEQSGDAQWKATLEARANELYNQSRGGNANDQFENLKLLQNTMGTLTGQTMNPAAQATFRAIAEMAAQRAGTSDPAFLNYLLGNIRATQSPSWWTQFTTGRH